MYFCSWRSVEVLNRLRVLTPSRQAGSQAIYFCVFHSLWGASKEKLPGSAVVAEIDDHLHLLLLHLLLLLPVSIVIIYNKKRSSPCVFIFKFFLLQETENAHHHHHLFNSDPEAGSACLVKSYGTQLSVRHSPWSTHVRASPPEWERECVW